MVLEKISFITEEMTGIIRPVMTVPKIPTFPTELGETTHRLEGPSLVDHEIKRIEDLLSGDSAHALRRSEWERWNVLHAQLASLRLEQFKQHALDTFPEERFYELNGDPVWMLYELPFWQAFRKVNDAMRLYTEQPYSENLTFDKLIVYLELLGEAHLEIKFWQQFSSEGRLGNTLRNTAITARDNPSVVFGSLGYSTITEAVSHIYSVSSQLSSQYHIYISPTNLEAIDTVKGIFGLASELGALHTTRNGQEIYDSNDHLLPGGRFLRWASDVGILPYETDTVQLFIDKTFPNSMLFWSEICAESGGNLYTMAYLILQIFQQQSA